MLTNLNQSAQKSHYGPTSKAVSRNVATNIVLAQFRMTVVLREMLMQEQPADVRPMVSQMLKIVNVVSTKQLSSLCHPSMNLNAVSWYTPGKTMKVSVNAQKRAGKRPFVAKKFFRPFLKNCEHEAFSKFLAASSLLDIFKVVSSPFFDQVV